MAPTCAGVGVITGVVDWVGAAPGDRRFDLISVPTPSSIRSTEDILRPARAHMSLRMVDWAIRHFSPIDVEH